MATKISKQNAKNVVETLKEIKAQPNMGLGIEEIEFPDGSKKSFVYNGEEDKQAAIKFAEICVNATSNTNEAKRMMNICYCFMVKGVSVDKIVQFDIGIELYLDATRKALYTAWGEEYVTLTDEEKNVEMSVDALELLLKERAARKMSTTID